MNFKHPRLDKWIPSTINISEEEYLSKFNCYKCKKNATKYSDRTEEFKLDRDISFDVYYWLMPYSKGNDYAYSYSEHELIDYFKCKPGAEQEDLLNIAKEIGIDKLVSLCTYHSLWLHYFHHFMHHSNSAVMEEWDTMYQSKHVHAKNELDILIYLLLTSDERKDLMEEIRHFSLCPPMRKDGIYGYEYQMTKRFFEQKKDMS